LIEEDAKFTRLFFSLRDYCRAIKDDHLFLLLLFVILSVDTITTIQIILGVVSLR
jgi:hypothetical protein